MSEVGSFKKLDEKDIVSTRTLLHEAIPITGTIIYGTYPENNIKNPSHGMFQSVYDYPYLSSSANHIFDITIGVSTLSEEYAGLTSMQTKKKNIYNQMAQMLVGYDVTGSVLEFDDDGNILAGGTKIREAIIMPFSRLLVKDEIKKGTFTMTLGAGNTYAAPWASTLTITDASGSNQYFVNSPVGEYGLLYTESPVSGFTKCGLLYYQAGIAVLTASVLQGLIRADGAVELDGTGNNFDKILSGSTIQTLANAVRQRIQNVQFNNTTELNSTIYFCRANHDEFNYSTNPTYLNNSKIRVKTNSTDEPISYITTIGMYNDNNELMAVAKLSEPLKKTPSTEFTIRCRLDY